MLEKEIIDYWTRRAPSYSEINQKELCGRQKELWTSYIMRRVQDAMPEREGIKALDIGAGPGFFSIILGMAGCEVTALDRNPAMMAEAKKTVLFMTGTASRSQKRVSLTAIFRPMLWPANASRDRCPFRPRNVLHGTGRYWKRWGCRSRCMRIFPKRSFFRRSS